MLSCVRLYFLLVVSMNDVTIDSQPETSIWAFVLHRIFVDAELPYTFAPGFTLDRATESQRDAIKFNIRRFEGISWLTPTEFYETDTVIHPNDNAASFHKWPLDENQWRYYVVTGPDHSLLYDLHLASNISSRALNLSFQFFRIWGALIPRIDTAYKQFSNGIPVAPERVTEDDLSEIREVFSNFRKLLRNPAEENSFPEVLRAINMFDSLQVLPDKSDFQVLGLFAIIEMLITHNPRLEDRGDSLTHQMQSKFPLLSRRFDRPLDFSVFGPGANEKKVWTALYAYRSAIAHGGLPDFDGKNLRVLQGSDVALSFLKASVKGLLRHSLKEPALFQDLRSC